MVTEQGRAQGQKKRQRKARRALLAFLKRLRKVCKTLETAEDWYKSLKKLESLLQEYEKELPPAYYQRVKDATRLADATSEGVKKACKVLQTEIEQVINVLPSGGLLGSALIVSLIAGAVAVGGVVGYLNFTAVEVVIANQGCNPIRLREGLPPGVYRLMDSLGVELPQQPIGSGERGVVKLPRVGVNIDATDIDAAGSGTITLTVLGIGASLPLTGGVDSVHLNGEPILGQRTAVNLGERAQHELIVTCR